MENRELKALLEGVAAGQVTAEAAADALRGFVDLGFARVDIDRARRRGLPEVVLGEGKTAQQIIGIARALYGKGQRVFVTRVLADAGAEIARGLGDLPVTYDADARALYVQDAEPEDLGRGTVLVVSAGTADRPVAAEAALTARLCGNAVETLHDVGVAGLHRILANLEQLRSAAVVIVVAGLEGALPSVVAGLVSRPVVAVPTSVGYGASFDGLAALLGMLNACAAGVTVVNIDNGFGAAYAATLMNRAEDL